MAYMIVGMRVYWSAHALPELDSLTRDQRREILQSCKTFRKFPHGTWLVIVTLASVAALCYELIPRFPSYRSINLEWVKWEVIGILIGACYRFATFQLRVKQALPEITERRREFDARQSANC